MDRAPVSGLQGTTPDWLRQRAGLSPDRAALVCSDRQWTFRELDGMVDGLVAGLRRCGVERGAMVALLAGNGAAYVAAVHAIPRAGGVLLPLNARLTAAELEWQVRDAGARHVLFDESQAGKLHGLGDGLELVSLEELWEAAREEPYGGPDPAGPAPATDSFDLAALHSVVYTSGTTGRPKGALLTFGNHFWSAAASAFNLGLLPDDRWLACLPLFHVGGLAILLRSVVYGMPVVLHETFDPSRVNQAIASQGVTIVSVVSSMLERMLSDRGGKPYPPSLRCVLLGGGPAPERLLRECVAQGVPVVQSYGLTEAASQVATLDPDDVAGKLGSSGKPLFGLELRIVSESGEECPPGVAGQILVRGPTVTPGYFRRPQETADMLADGWLHTGDLGYRDAGGYLSVLDRRDDLIVSGGENVYPAEIEAVLESHPSVLEAGVYGVADERWGQSPVAVAVLRPGEELAADALMALCRERLAPYKLPKRLDFAASLPRNAAGKLLRRELRDQQQTTGSRDEGGATSESDERNPRRRL